MQSHAGTFESTCCCSLRVVIMKMFSVSLAVSVSPRGHRSSLLMNSVERSAPVTEDSEFHYDTRARIAATAEILPCTHWDANACIYCSSAQMCRNLLSVIEDASPVISSAWFSLVSHDHCWEQTCSFMFQWHLYLQMLISCYLLIPLYLQPKSII